MYALVGWILVAVTMIAIRVAIHIVWSPQYDISLDLAILFFLGLAILVPIDKYVADKFRRLE